MKRVFVITETDTDEGIEYLIPFGQASKQQLESNTRLVFDKRGCLVSRINPADALAMLQVEHELEARRKQILVACGGAV